MLPDQDGIVGGRSGRIVPWVSRPWSGTLGHRPMYLGNDGWRTVCL